MNKKTERHFDFEIDKLTNSIENSLTGEVFDTEVVRITEVDLKSIKKSEWQFDWHKEFKDNTKLIFKLYTHNNPTIIQGLISIEDKQDHIFMHLVESANFNKGRNKVYLGVPGNLVAYACKFSVEKGYAGFVAFDSKTILVKHYQQTQGASHLRGQRMYIETKAATNLILRYFKS